MSSLVMTGIGGQGTILWTKVMCNAWHAEGIRCHSLETLGGMQRGGPVYVQVQFGEDAIGGAIVHTASADLVFAQEIYEGMRISAKFLKDGGTLLQNEKIVPVVGHYRTKRGFLGPSEYEELMPACVGTLHSVNATNLAREAGNPRAENMSMWGVAMGLGLIPGSPAAALEMIRKYIPGRSGEFSLGAFDRGLDAADRGLVHTQVRSQGGTSAPEHGAIVARSLK